VTAWAVDRYGPIADLSHGFQDSFYRWLLYFSPYLRLGEFLLGCLIAQLYLVLLNRSVNTLELRLGMAALAVALASVPALTYLMYSPNGWVALRKLNLNFGLAPSVAIIVFCLARYQSPLYQMLSCRPLVILGEASYSIYLLHFFVFRQAQSIGALTLFAKPHQGYAEVLPPFLGRLGLTIGVVLIVALLSYRFVEVPARRWLRSLSARNAEQPFRNAAVVTLTLLFPATVLAAHPHAVQVGDDVARGIRVISATYGLNCGAPPGNATHQVQRACNGRDDCRYIVSVVVLGDSAPNCGKSFRVEYACVPNPSRLAAEIPGESGFNSPILLSCNLATTSVNVR
jgi:hypothetical protein